MKIRSKCNLQKDENSFQKSKSRCKDCIKEYRREYLKNTNKVKEYLENNKDRLKEYSKKYKDINKGKIQEYYKQYYIKNKEDLILSRKEYQIKYRKYNKEDLQKLSNEWRRNRKKVDSLYSLKEGIRTSISQSLSYNKTKSTEEILGCSFMEFKLHLESKFEPWMNWMNRGLYNGELNFGWDIDHIIPLSSANNIEEIIKLNHYTNLQPLCSYTNRYIKRDSLNA